MVTSNKIKYFNEMRFVVMKEESFCVITSVIGRCSECEIFLHFASR